MRNNLIPTPITDKNGRLTTVHRRNGAAAPKASSLAGIKPSLPAKTATSANPSDDKIVKVKWKISDSSFLVSEGSFLDRAGLADAVGSAEIKAKGHPMTRSEVFEFMKHGITFYQAAALHQIGGPLEEWENNPEFMNALPGDEGRIFVGDWKSVALEETMELLKREGVSLNRAHKLVKNGLSDEIVQRSVLSPDEIISLFSRFSLRHSVNAGSTTNSAATMNALNEGRLPSSLIDNMDADKSTMTAVLYALYPPEKKKDVAVTLASDTISESTRQELIADPEKLSQVIMVMSKYSDGFYGIRLDSVDLALSSIKDYGLEASIKNNPILLNHVLSNGERIGPKRMEAAKATTRAIGAIVNPDPKSSDVYPTSTGIIVTKGRQKIALRHTDIAEFKMMGFSEYQIFEKTIGADIDSNRALAIAQNHVSPAVSSGWL